VVSNKSCGIPSGHHGCFNIELYLKLIKTDLRIWMISVTPHFGNLQMASESCALRPPHHLVDDGNSARFFPGPRESPEKP
jgi:hypothetical protein